MEHLRKKLACIEITVNDLKLEFCHLKEDLNEKLKLLKDEFANNWMDTVNQVTALNEVAAIHKEQVEVLSDEFYTYAKITDDIEEKLHQLTTTIAASQDFMSTPMLPTPPPSNMKKRPP